MEPTTISWIELLVLMVGDRAEPEPPISGTIRSYRSDGDLSVSFGWFASHERPVIAGVGPGWAEGDTSLQRVWRDGAKVRIEEADGTPSLLADETRSWQFRAGDPVPVESPRSALRFLGRGTELLVRRDPNGFLGDDFTRPTGPVTRTTFLGRPAWTVELAPPEHKPAPMQVVVDAATGVELQRRVDGAGAVDEWTELVVGPQVQPATFVWDGPTRSADEVRQREEGADRAEAGRRHEWFRANVTEQPLAVEVTVDLEIETIHHYDEATGAFEASVGRNASGSLARRPRSDAPWDLDWYGDHQHRWSTARWDWAVMLHDLELGSAARAQLERLLPDA